MCVGLLLIFDLRMFFGNNNMSKSKIRIFIEDHLLTIEIALLITALILSCVLQFLVDHLDMKKIIDVSWLINIYKWIISSNSDSFLNIIDGFAIACGGISFFLNKWIEDDTENIVYVLFVVISLTAAHIVKLIGLHVISFFICVAAGILVLIPFGFLVTDNLRNSKRRNLKRNRPRFSKRIKNEKNKR